MWVQISLCTTAMTAFVYETQHINTGHGGFGEKEQEDTIANTELGFVLQFAQSRSYNKRSKRPNMSVLHYRPQCVLYISAMFKEQVTRNKHSCVDCRGKILLLDILCLLLSLFIAQTMQSQCESGVVLLPHRPWTRSSLTEACDGAPLTHVFQSWALTSTQHSHAKNLLTSDWINLTKMV